MPRRAEEAGDGRLRSREVEGGRGEMVLTLTLGKHLQPP